MSTSKQLGSLIKKAPPATVREEAEASAPAPAPSPAIVERVAAPAPAPAKPAMIVDPDVPTQIKIPRSVRKQLDHLSIDTGEDLRVLVLRALRSLGITVPEEHLKARRGKRF